MSGSYDFALISALHPRRTAIGAPETRIYLLWWPSPAWGLGGGGNPLLCTEPGTVEMSRKCLLNKLSNESTIDSTRTKKGRLPRWGFPPQAWPARSSHLPHLGLTCPQIQTGAKGEGCDLEREACLREGNKGFCCGQARELPKLPVA